MRMHTRPLQQKPSAQPAPAAAYQGVQPVLVRYLDPQHAGTIRRPGGGVCRSSGLKLRARGRRCATAVGRCRCAVGVAPWRWAARRR